MQATLFWLYPRCTSEQFIIHCQKLGQKGDLVIKVSQSKRNYKDTNLLVEANRKHGFDLKTLISISNYSSSSYGDSRALPLSPLAATDPFGWWRHYLFHPWPWLRHLSSDLISHPYTEGMFTSFLFRGVWRREKDQSVQYSYRLNQSYLFTLNFSHLTYRNDSMRIIPKTKQYYCRSFTSLQLFNRNATLTISSLSTSVMIFRFIF